MTPLALIRQTIEQKYGGDLDTAAEAWGCTRGTVLRAIRGATNPTHAMLKDAGLVLAYAPQQLLEQGQVQEYLPAKRQRVGRPRRVGRTPSQKAQRRQVLDHAMRSLVGATS